MIQQILGEEPSSSGAQKGMRFEMILVSLCVLVFVLAVLYMIAVMRNKGSISANLAFKMFTLVFIIGSALFLLPAGWSQTQISPIVGLLGTALGFIFGKDMPNSGEGINAPTKSGEPVVASVES